ncbi:MAG: IS110 family transposase [bacterium]|nr:MAG: IS110 family transposase [bacterium]
MYHTTIAVDLAKNIFEIAVSKHPGCISERHRFSRSKFQRFFAEHLPATVLFEACGSAHHWARTLNHMGHNVILLPPHSVRPYVTRNKTDRSDAKAILEAFRNEDIHPVPIKTIDQHIIASLHRYRYAWLAERTARINAFRGILRELGHAIPVGSRRLVPAVHALLGEQDTIPQALAPALIAACEEITALEKRIRGSEHHLASFTSHHPIAQRLMTIPGIGLLTATTLIAFVGDIHRFPSGRHFASYLGLTPREHSSGSRRYLGRISKRGDSYLRMLLVHGARSVLWVAKNTDHPDRLRIWALELERTRGHNKAAVALANKLARIAWAVWKRNRIFESMREV